MKKVAIWICACLLIVSSLLGCPEKQESPTGRANPSTTQETYQRETPKEVTVYITRTGRNYHRITCRYLSKSCISINLNDAKRRDYTACSVCRPPIPLACQSNSNYHLVTRVIDGDTIVLENGTRVRYIGIDTPERDESGYKEATEANRKLVDGKKVRLEYDADRTDRYGRTLAYVYVNGTFVNAYLVENGFAEVMTIKPNVEYKELFLELEQKARDSEKELWGK